MKKFDIKWLLILVLVVILAFGLVACGNKGGGSETPEEEEEQKVVDPYKSSASEFFGTLWNASKSLGATEVDPTKDKVHIGAAMDISLTSDNVSELDVGVKFGLVADLASMNKDDGDLGDTALMLQAYDKATDANWITLWYFLNEEDRNFIYLRVQDEYFKVNFNAYWNDEFSTLLEGVLTTNYSFLKDGTDSNGNEKHTNILNLINGIAKTGGANWTLDSLILGDKATGFKGLLYAFGLDLNSLLDSLPASMKGSTSGSENSLGALLTSLGGVVIESKECKKYPNDDGSTTYKAGNVSSMVPTIANPLTDNLFKSIDYLSLSYNVTKKGAIDDFVIAIKGKKDLINTEIKIAITELIIETVNNQDAEKVLGKKTNTYQSYANLHFSGVMDASAWGIVINPNDYPISIGRVTLDIDACLDLVGDYTHNQTVAALTLKNDNVVVLKAVYKDNALVLQANLDNENNKNIAMAALYPLAKWIQEAAVNGDDVTVPYKIFGDLADAVLHKTNGMFTYDEHDKVDGVNKDFDTIAITGVDIATLAKGAFYAIFSDFATGAGDEKPAKAAELTTYDGDTYKLGTIEYKDSQYKWALNIKQTVTTVLKAIKYNGGTETTATDKDYSIELTSIYSTLSKIFKDATLKDVDESKGSEETVKAPASVDEMMALFMCTNDGILLDMTKHGLLPLYKNGITTKYITSTYTPAMAADEGYYAIPGKMISKDNAKALWAFFTNPNPTALTLTGITVGTYFNPDHANEPEKDDLAGYATNSAIAWFVKFIKGTQLTNGKTAANIVGDLTGTNSGLKISLNRKTGHMGCEITLAGSKLSGTAEYKFYGSDDNTIALAKSTFTGAPVKTDADYTVTLNNAFYSLFKAQFGMGANTDVKVGHGLNKDLYILASDATYVDSSDPDELGNFTSITYLHAALIRTNDTTGYALVTKDGIIDEDITINTATEGKITISGTNAGTLAGTYTIKGNAYVVLDKD